MNKLFATVLVAFVLGVPVANAAESPAWRDVLSTCSAEWKERGDKDTNKGMAAWQEYLTACKERKGFTPKRSQTREFNRVPDKS